jgi:hypothetical protein
MTITYSQYLFFFLRWNLRTILYYFSCIFDDSIKIFSRKTDVIFQSKTIFYTRYCNIFTQLPYLFCLLFTLRHDSIMYIFRNRIDKLKKSFWIFRHNFWIIIACNFNYLIKRIGLIKNFSFSIFLRHYFHWISVHKFTGLQNIAQH